MGHKNVTAMRVCTDHSVNLSEPGAFPSPNKALKPVLAEKHFNFLYLGGAETVLGLTDKLVPVPGARGVHELPRPAALAG